MNIVIEKDAGFFICTIVRLGERNFGFAEFEGNTIHFHLNQGRGIVPGRVFPEFIDQPPAPVTEGDLIIVLPRWNDERESWHATIWGAASELFEAEQAIESRGKSQPAPKCPLIPKTAPQSKVDRRDKSKKRVSVAA